VSMRGPRKDSVRTFPPSTGFAAQMSSLDVDAAVFAGFSDGMSRVEFVGQRHSPVRPQSSHKGSKFLHSAEGLCSHAITSRY
jgi:hypothetical protein